MLKPPGPYSSRKARGRIPLTPFGEGEIKSFSNTEIDKDLVEEVVDEGFAEDTAHLFL